MEGLCRGAVIAPSGSVRAQPSPARSGSIADGAGLSCGPGGGGSVARRQLPHASHPSPTQTLTSMSSPQTHYRAVLPPTLPPAPPVLPPSGLSEIGEIRPLQQQSEGPANVLAARNVTLCEENARMREDLAGLRRRHEQREAELLAELDELRASFQSVEQHVFVTEGRFAGLLEAARKEWAAEAAMGGRAEAARLTTSLVEVRSAEKLLQQREEHILRLQGDIENHDTAILKADAMYESKLNKAEVLLFGNASNESK